MKQSSTCWKTMLLFIVLSIAACGGGGGGSESDDAGDGNGSMTGGQPSDSGGSGSGNSGGGEGIYEEFGQGQVGNLWMKKLAREDSILEVSELVTDWRQSLYLSGVMDEDPQGASGKAERWHFFLAKYDSKENNILFNTFTHDSAVKPRIAGMAEFSGEIYLLVSSPSDDSHRTTVMVFDNETGELTREFPVSFGTKKFYAEDLAVLLFDVWVVGAVYDNDLDSAQYMAAKYKSQTGALLYTVTGDSSIGPGQGGRSHATAIAPDPQGSVYIVGETQGSLHGEPMSGTHRGLAATDGFLVKILDAGYGQVAHQVVFTKQFGAEVGNVRPKDVAYNYDRGAVEVQGRIIIVGEVEGRFMYSNQYGEIDGFFLAYDQTNGKYGGEGLLPRQFGSHGAKTRINRVALSPQSDFYVAGHTTGNVAFTNRAPAGHLDAFLMNYKLDGYRVGIKQFGKPGSYNYNTALAVAIGSSSFDPTAIFQGISALEDNGSNPEVILRRDNGKWGPEPKPPNPGTGSGNNGGGNNGGGSNTLDWKSTWFYVQSDKALQFRLAKVRAEGPYYVFRVQYRVNTSSNVYHPSSQGYHVYHRTDTGVKYRVNFPSSFTNKIYDLPIEIKIAVDGKSVTFDPSDNWLRGHGGSYTWCVDSNATTSRCERNGTWKPNEMNENLTAR